MKRVIVESPYAGQVGANVQYARLCVRDALMRGEAPIASHLLYTQPGILRDGVPEERQLGINAGLAWRSVAEASVVYTDRGISSGMEHGISVAKESGVPVEMRSIGIRHPTTAISVADVVKQIGPVLAGYHPAVQGAVIADLLAIWLAGYRPPEVREDLLQMHIERVRELIPVNDKIIRGE